MRAQRTMTGIVVFVPLVVLFTVGVTAGMISSFFDWIDGKCRDWFTEIYGK